MAYTDVLAGAMATQGPGSSGVEQRIENPRVGGSIPPPGTTFLNMIISAQHAAKLGKNIKNANAKLSLVCFEVYILKILFLIARKANIASASAGR